MTLARAFARSVPHPARAQSSLPAPPASVFIRAVPLPQLHEPCRRRSAPSATPPGQHTSCDLRTHATPAGTTPPYQPPRAHGAASAAIYRSHLASIESSSPAEEGSMHWQHHRGAVGMSLCMEPSPRCCGIVDRPSQISSATSP
jgi:hypothetical protein